MLSHRSLENASSEPSTPASSPLRIVEDGDADRAEEVGIHRLAERRALDCRSHTLRPVANIHSQPPPSSRRGRSPRCRVLRYRERPLSTTPKHLGSFWKDASQRHVARGEPQQRRKHRADADGEVVVPRSFHLRAAVTLVTHRTRGNEGDT